MAEQVVLIKTQDGSLRPATAYDAELMQKFKIGSSLNVEVKNKRTRSYQHHKMYFGGLLPFLFDYWTPSGGMLSKNEIDAIAWVGKYTEMELSEAHSGLSGVLTRTMGKWLKKLAIKRAEQHGVPIKDIEAFRDWLTVEAGYFDILDTPKGVIKRPKSISFANMEQGEFSKFYNACFNVGWNMILNDKFQSEEEAQQAINEYAMLGG